MQVTLLESVRRHHVRAANNHDATPSASGFWGTRRDYTAKPLLVIVRIRNETRVHHTTEAMMDPACFILEKAKQPPCFL
eukprot:scaffold277329_cov41-Prasinocladus_malaysianus.AAC.1